jgi:uncharacterized protein YjbJ (UPF0337 family)
MMCAHLPVGQGLLRNNEVPMTDNRKTPSTDHLKGSVTEAIGKLTGAVRVEAEGRRQKRDAEAPKSGRPKPSGSEGA